MKVKELAFVCYPVKSIKKARDFYEGILGLKPSTTDWVKSDTSGMIEYILGDNTAFSIGAGAGNFKPGKEGPSAALEVEDFDEAVKDLKKNNVKFLMEPMDSGVCHMTLVEDPDGNQIMIHQRYPERK
jgi:predicted enzyme related to lactoylglutathione lyase